MLISMTCSALPSPNPSLFLLHTQHHNAFIPIKNTNIPQTFQYVKFEKLTMISFCCSSSPSLSGLFKCCSKSLTFSSTTSAKKTKPSSLSLPLSLPLSSLPLPLPLPLSEESLESLVGACVVGSIVGPAVGLPDGFNVGANVVAST